MNEPNTKPLPGKAALLGRIEETFSQVQTALDALDEGAMIREVGGGWTVKDTLAHIAAWEEILLRFHLGGEPFDRVIDLSGAEYRKTSFDDVNAHLHEMHRGLASEQVRHKLLDTHAALLEALADFPEEQLHQPHPRLSTGPAAGVCWIDYIAANTYEHYEEHLKQLGVDE